MVFRSGLATLICLVLLSLTSAAEEGYRFGFVGCNRVGFEVDPSQNPSTANLRQLEATFRDVARANPRPKYFFFLGDLILGYTSYLSTVDQLEAWQRLYERSPLAKTETTLVPITGNHELLLSVQNPRTKRWADYPNPPAERAWTEVLASLLKWKDGPKPEGENLDHLTSDQSVLSFTVRDRDICFVILNTDTFIDGITTGDIPLHWLERQLSEAQSDPTVKHIFVLGHKPLMEPGLPAWIVRPEERAPACDLLARHSKVRAYLTAHYHFWDVRRLPGGVPQVIAGNGGSQLKGPFKDREKGYFGFTMVEVDAKGQLRLESWGRPVPEPYYADVPPGTTTLRKVVTLAPR